MIENSPELNQKLLEVIKKHKDIRVRKSYEDGAVIHATLNVDSVMEDIRNGASPEEVQKTVEAEMDRIHAGNYKAFKFEDSVKL